MVNPFREIKMWVKWEMLDINAFLEAASVKAMMEAKKAERQSKK